ncbi:MAG: 2-C-methyl-D-erythritol 4-phosphate cytidylyltransferase [Phycisphaerales bacterium]|nr:2-C-methyl-D-erythritol 4-phosphate cytidylyltransferase [Phycisphaerales bacterium]MCB9835114.1 2-C-methyl-D-erythritol 4-phosphate cytidylyltransferase [Phycisphaera sp.]
MNLTVIIPAAGASTRYSASGGLRHKLEEDIAGRAVLYRSLEIFTVRDDVKSIIVAGPHDEAAFDEFREHHGPKIGFYGAKLCRGGQTHRYESVQAALAEVDHDCTHVAIHDAARPCASQRLIDRVLEAAQSHDAVIPAIAVGDTIKRAESIDDAGAEDPLDALLGDSGKINTSYRRVMGTVDRAGLVLVQTPQVFKRELIERAYAQNDLASTDDAGLVERLGEPVIVVEGEARNIKITRAEDLEIARALFGPGENRDRASHKRF